jgi:hypothetical protein
MRVQHPEERLGRMFDLLLDSTGGIQLPLSHDTEDDYRTFWRGFVC